jgi:hypothetical protein
MASLGLGKTRGVCVAAAMILAGGAACTPKLTAPHESIRVSGTIEDPTPPPPEVAARSDAPQTHTPAPDLGAPKAKPLRTYPVLHHLPLGVAIYEACSPELVVFKKCPGRFLGEAKLANPGPFVVEVDTEAPEIVVFAFRGFLGPEQTQEACAEKTIPIAQAEQPLTLKLEPGTCSIKLERRYG